MAEWPDVILCCSEKICKLKKIELLELQSYGGGCLFTNESINYIVAVSLIVYDNSCNLHSYCLNRNQGFFGQTKFVKEKPRDKECHVASKKETSELRQKNVSQETKLHDDKLVVSFDLENAFLLPRCHVSTAFYK